MRLQVAACLMGAALPQGACAARMLLFVGGPSTEGAGKVVDRELSEPIRSHEVGWHVLPTMYTDPCLGQAWVWTCAKVSRGSHHGHLMVRASTRLRCSCRGPHTSNLCQSEGMRQ